MLFTRIKNGHNVLMLQTACGFSLAEKPLTRIVEFFAFKLLAECHGFDGNDTANFWILAEVHHAHRAFAQFFFNLVAAQHRLFNTATIQQHGAAWMAATAAQNYGFSQVFGTAEFGLQAFEVLVLCSHVLVHGFRLVELTLALKVKRQVAQVVHQRVAVRHAAKPVKCHIELALSLMRQSHHAVGFGGLFVRLELARLRHQKAFGGQCQVSNHQQ